MIKEALAADLSDLGAYGIFKYASFGEFVNKLIGPGLALAMLGVLFYLVTGAIKLMVSGGEKEKVAAARESITRAIIGLVLIFAVFLLADLVPYLLGIRAGLTQIFKFGQ